MSTRTRIAAATFVAAAGASVVVAAPAQAAPDTACMRAGIATLKGAGRDDEGGGGDAGTGAHDFLLQGLRPVGLSMCER